VFTRYRIGNAVFFRISPMSWEASLPLLRDSTTRTLSSPMTKPALVAVWSVSSTSSAITANTSGAISRPSIRTSAGSKGLLFCCISETSSVA